MLELSNKINQYLSQHFNDFEYIETDVLFLWDIDEDRTHLSSYTINTQANKDIASVYSVKNMFKGLVLKKENHKWLMHSHNISKDPLCLNLKVLYAEKQIKSYFSFNHRQLPLSIAYLEQIDKAVKDYNFKLQLDPKLRDIFIYLANNNNTDGSITNRYHTYLKGLSFWTDTTDLFYISDVKDKNWYSFMKYKDVENSAALYFGEYCFSRPKKEVDNLTYYLDFLDFDSILKFKDILKENQSFDHTLISRALKKFNSDEFATWTKFLIKNHPYNIDFTNFYDFVLTVNNDEAVKWLSVSREMGILKIYG